MRGTARRPSERWLSRVEQPGDSSAAGQLQADGVGGARLERSRLTGTLIERDAHRDALAHLADRLDAAGRLLDQLESGRCECSDRGDRLLDAPRAVGIQTQRRAGAGRGAHRRHASRVVAEPDLELETAEPGRDSRGRLLCRASSVAGADDRVYRHRAERPRRLRGVQALGELLADQRRERLATQTRRPVPQREVDCCKRLGQIVGCGQTASSSAAGSASASSSRRL